MKSLYNCLLLSLISLFCSTARAADVTIDCKDGYSISAVTNGSVQLTNRTFTANEWTGFCIPFDASEAVLTATFGSGYSLQEFSSYAETTNTVSFKKVTAAKAGTPYFIKVAQTDEDPTFEGVTIANATSDKSFQEVTIATDLILRGFYFNTYDYQLYDQKNENTFYWIQADGTMKSMQDNIYQDGGRRGTSAYIIRKNYQSYTNKTPTLSFEDASSGEGGNTGGDTGGGESGGGDTGDTSSLSYKIAHKQQLTDVPTIYITLTTQNDNITDETLNSVLYKDRSTGDAPYLDATIQVLDNKTDKSGVHLEEFTDEVQIKVRGNSTANPLNGKKAYRLKFPKKHKHDLLGLGYTKRNWTLLANVFDHSMIRNALTYHLNKEVGMDFCPGYKFVDVVINGNYRGTYQISDHVEADANRVNVNEDTGWMVEFQGRSDMLDKPVCFSQNGLQLNIKNPEPEDDTDEASVAAVVTPIQNWFIKTWQPKWTSSSAFSSTKGWRSVNDEESLLKFWLVTELTGDYDGWMTVKAYKEADGDKLFYGPVWDKDLAYGNCTYENSDILVYNNSGNGSSLTGYLQTIAKDPAFAKKVSTTLNSLLDGGLIDRLKAKVDELSAIVAQTEELNNTKYPRTTNVGGLEVAGKETYAEYVQLLKDYLDKRATVVKEQVASILAAATTKKTITLDPTKNSWDSGYQGLYDYAGAYADVTISPATTVASDSWSTIFLPFDATESQVKAALGGDFVLATLTSCANGTFHFAQTDDKNIVASTPYLIKMKSGSSTGTSWTFKDVTMMDANDNAQSLHGDSIKASFHPQTPSPNTTAYYLSGNQLVQFDSQYGGTSNPIYNIVGFHFYFVSSTTPSIEITENETLPATHGQLTNLPTIYISGTATDSWSRCGVEIYDKDKKIGGTATYEATDTKKGVQFQYQGSGSGGKDSFRFKFDKKTQLLSSGKFKQWVLSSNDDDPTMLNNALAFDMSENLGLAFTPKYQFVDLYVNDTYMGTYQLCDRVKAEDGRALTAGGDKDKDWLVQLASKGEVKEEGDYYMKQGDFTPNIIVKNPDPDDYSTDAEKSALVNEVGGWLRDTFFKDIKSISENVNKEQLIKYYIAQEVLCTYKGLSSVNAWRSVTAADQSVYFGPIWDSEKSFGNTAKHPINMNDLNTDGSYDGLITEYADYKIMRRFFKNLWVQPWFADGVVEKWQSVSADLKTLLKSKVTSLAAEIKTSRELNYSKASAAGTGWELKDATSYDAAIEALNTYIEQRFAYLDKKFVEMQTNEKGHITYNTNKTDAMDAWAFYDNVETSVKLKKRGTIHGGEWNMITLPFDLDASGIAAVFGSGAQVKEFTRTDETSTTVGLYFTAVPEIKAGMPYIVKPTADVAESGLLFSNVVFNTGDAQSVEKGSYTLHGTLVKTKLTPAGTDDHTIKYLGTGTNANTLLYLTGETSINGCRGYFTTTTEAAAKSVVFVDDETSGISTIESAHEWHGPIYNLQGQLMGTSIDALPSGIYIIGGRKFAK